MVIIISMAGLGTRFRNAGYKCPKYMIEAKGRTLFEWSLESLKDYNPHTEKYIFVVRKEDGAENFIREKSKLCGVKEADILELDHVTDGQATTCMLAVPRCDSGSPVMIYNIDTYVEAGAMKFSDISGDGHIPCFHAEGTHWSFVRTDGGGHITEVREKVRISDNCSLGAYYFSSAGLYRSLYEEFYSSGSGNTEKYIAPMYSAMIRRGLSVTMSLVGPEKVHVLGTPEELETFIKS